MNTYLFALVALVPMITGPLPEEEKLLVAGLCDGGVIEIPLRDEEKEPHRDCHQDGCHAGNCREKSKRSKLI